MKAVPFILFALSFEPTADDWRHFDLPFMPALLKDQYGNQFGSPVRVTWQRSEYCACATWNYARKYGMVDEEAWPRAWEAQWRARAWYWADDIADASKQWEWRLDSARKLRAHLGPLGYATGRMPVPWVEGRDD